MQKGLICYQELFLKTLSNLHNCSWIRMKNTSEIVRSELISEILRLLNSETGIKLIAVPFMGVSTIMERIWTYCKPGGELYDRCIAFYFKKEKYELDLIKEEFSDQLRYDHGYSVVSFKSDSLHKLCKEVLSIVERKGSNKMLLFIFDNFQKHFTKYTIDEYDSILDKYTISNIRNLSQEKDTKLRFIVNYHVPVDPLVGDDWYLNTFRSVYVKLLTESQAREMISIIRRNNGLEINQSIIGQAMRYGGLHPQTLELAAKQILDNGKIPLSLKNKLENRFLAIVNFMKKKGTEAEDDKWYYLGRLISMTANPISLKLKDGDLISSYFYSTGEKIEFFSEFFREYINQKRKEMGDIKQSDSKTVENVIETIWALLATLIIVGGVIGVFYYLTKSIFVSVFLLAGLWIISVTVYAFAIYIVRPDTEKVFLEIFQTVARKVPPLSLIYKRKVIDVRHVKEDP